MRDENAVNEQKPELDLGEEESALMVRLEEIKKLKAERAAAARAEALKPVIAAIKEHGFSAAELGLFGFAKTAAPATEKPAKAPVEPKYRDTESGKTWTGRGKTPGWLSAKLAAGEPKEVYLISPPAPQESSQPDGENGLSPDGPEKSESGDFAEDDNQIRRDLAA